MPELRFTKGDMVANAFVNALDDGRYRGLVLIVMLAPRLHIIGYRTAGSPFEGTVRSAI